MQAFESAMQRECSLSRIVFNSFSLVFLRRRPLCCCRCRHNAVLLVFFFFFFSDERWLAGSAGGDDAFSGSIFGSRYASAEKDLGVVAPHIKPHLLALSNQTLIQ